MKYKEMPIFFFTAWVIFTISTNDAKVVTFRIRNCSYEFFSTNFLSRSFVQIPITAMQMLMESPVKNIYVCMVKKGVNVTAQLKLLKLENQTSFDCTYKGSYWPHEEAIIQTLLKQFTVIDKNITIENTLRRIIHKVLRSERELDFEFLISDLIIELMNFRNFTSLMQDENMFKWWYNVTATLLREFNYFSIVYLSALKNINVGGWVNELASVTFEVLKNKLFISFVGNKLNNEFMYAVFDINSTYRCLTVTSRDMKMRQEYIIVVWKSSNNMYTTCTVWFDSKQQMQYCNVTSNLPNWDVCRCNVLGVVVIQILKITNKMEHELFRFGGLTPAFIDILNVKKLEGRYRYGRMGDWLMLSAIIVLAVNMFFLVILIIYYHHRWKCFSPTRRQILCLFILMWLNILLIQPLLISYVLRERTSALSTEYIAWGFLALYSISTYTMMIGGSQIVLFVATVNSKMWACRFCDFILGFVAIICCSLPLFIFFHAYHSVVVSINKPLLLPETYGTLYLVMFPLIFVTAICFVLSGLSCYLPKRGGGITMMSVMYPLLILHAIAYVMVILMKDGRNNYNDFHYLIYCACMFFQAIYLMMWEIVLMLLPTKKMTIFGKRDCNFRLEYIYLIDLQCPPHEETSCVQLQN